MRNTDRRLGMLLLLAAAAATPLHAQDAAYADPNIIVNGEVLPDVSEMTAGPEIKGIITARNGDLIKVTAADGTSTTVAVTETARIRSRGGFLGTQRTTLTPASLFNGLPVTIRTLQWSGGLVASQIDLKGSDLKVASMIHAGTEQQFSEQTAATEALRGRVGDIDKYNVKSTTSVYFDTGKATLSDSAKAQLCNTATTAGAMENALLLVVGYTDSTGDQEFNQVLSERRAASVINYLQQVCRWAPYRVLTPTGMAEADPVASNDTVEGKAQNRRVAVNILVSKAVDVD